jgi:aminotransferase
MTASNAPKGPPFADRIDGLAQSDIRRMSVECAKVGGINLSQGVCDQPVPDLIKKAAVKAIGDDRSIYSRLEGITPLRQCIARKMRDFNGIECDPETQVVVTVGSTGGFVAVCMALLNPGDEVILFEPFYGYHVNILKLMGAKMRFVTTRPPEWQFDADELRAAFTDRTRMVLVNTPSNPSGKVFSREELTLIGDLCKQHGALALTDEIYEYITYDGHEHLSMASLPGMADHTITLSGFSKTYNMTGWRLGYTVGPAPWMAKIGVLNDLLSICAPTPLQHAVLAAFDLPSSYYDDLIRDYTRKLEMTWDACLAAGLTPYRPQGSYYLLLDITGLGAGDDQQAARMLLDKHGLATVPASSFYADPAHGRGQVRLCYAKKEAEMEEACRRLRQIRKGHQAG